MIEGKLKRTRRRYSDSEKASALALHGFNADLVHPLTATANALRIPDATLHNWQSGRGVSATVVAIGEMEKRSLSDLCEEYARTALSKLIPNLDEIKPRDFASIGIAIDKMLLLRGQATAITEHRRGVTPEQARQLLADYVASGCDETQARALLAEDFPEAANALVN
jgi:hypothetical protein